MALTDISHVIQLAVAPVFLLTAIGTFLGVLVARLGRAVDRSRVLMAHSLEEPLAATGRAELAVIASRERVIYAAIALSVCAALLLCLVIGSAFLGLLIGAQSALLIVVLFVMTMLGMIGSLALFLREIYLGVNTVPTPVR